jgi:DNA-directed RNA polymerase subunit M/transcription elongation factor TFIIS
MPPKVSTSKRSGALASTAVRRQPSKTTKGGEKASPTIDTTNANAVENSDAKIRSAIEYVNTLDSHLSEDLRGNLTLEQRYYRIASLAYPNGVSLFTPATKSLLIDFGGLIHEYGFVAAISYAENGLRANVRAQTLFLNSMGMRKAIRALRDRITKITQEVEIVQGLYKCKNCRSSNTIAMPKQTRSADEGFTLFITCRDCGQNFVKAG